MIPGIPEPGRRDIGTAPIGGPLRSAGLPAALLALQLGLIGWMAPRGLDLTDESYALLSLMHWRDLAATPTLFAMFVGPVFDALNHNVAAMRVLGAASLAASAGLATWAILRLYRPLDAGTAPHGPGLIVAGMSTGLLYYSFAGTMRLPSYNLLVLAAMLCATALLCVVVEPGRRGGRAWVAAVGYGATVVVVGLAKPTSGVAMLLCHAVFAAAIWPAAPVRERLGVLAAALAGMLAATLAVTAAHPNWWRVMSDGAALAQITDGRTVSVVLQRLFEDISRSAGRLAPSLLILSAAALWGILSLSRRRPDMVSWIVCLVTMAVVLGSLLRGYGKSWWVLYVLALALCAWILWRGSAAAVWARERRVGVALVALLMALPVAFSIGTNGSLPAHTQMASSFAAIALLVALWRLCVAGLLRDGALRVCLAVVAGAGVLVLWPTLNDPAATYRLGTGLRDQTHAVATGAGRTTIHVDAALHRETEALRALARDAGFQPGTTLIDLTGDGPGWVYLLDARPMGLAWIIGGYSGSAQAARWMLRRQPTQRLRESWVLTAEGNPRSIAQAPDWLLSIDPTLRYRRVGAVAVAGRYSFDAMPHPPQPTLVLWQPVAGVGD